MDGDGSQHRYFTRCSALSKISECVVDLDLGFQGRRVFHGGVRYVARDDGEDARPQPATVARRCSRQGS